MLNDLTLPGSILWPDLVGLRVTNGQGREGTVTRRHDGSSARVLVSWGGGVDLPVSVPVHTLNVVLDPTGCCHAAWWLAANWSPMKPASGIEARALDHATRGLDMTDLQIAALRDLVLRLAGRGDAK